MLEIDVHQLCHYPLFLGNTQVIGQHHAKGLIAHQQFSGEHSVAQALHFRLARGGEAGLGDDLADTAEVFFLIGTRYLMFKFEADIKKVMDRALATPCHQTDLVKPGIEGLFNAILHQRFVDHRQHLLGHRLGGRQKPGAITGHGKQTFLDHSGFLHISEPVPTVKRASAAPR